MICDNLIFEGTKEEISSENKYGIDIAVLLIFFNRPQKIKQVFEQVKKVKPSRLYLYQDGVRGNRLDDIDSVRSCRDVVKDIDWNCTVHRLYQQKNYGCDPSEYIAQKWFFSNEEMGIVLEDDDVPSVSFFQYCKELLQKYRDDNRIAIICGMNNFDIENSVSDSYFFSKRGSIWGWASWKRFFDLWDSSYTWLDNPDKIGIIRNYCDCALNYDQYEMTAIRHRESNREHYESIMFAAAALNNMLNIVPKYNMISNIGIDKETTHSVSDIRLLCKRVQKLMYKKTYELTFPIEHPSVIEQNKDFDRKYKITRVQKMRDGIEIRLRKMLFLELPKIFIKKSNV